MKMPRVNDDVRLQFQRLVKWAVTGLLTLMIDLLSFRTLYPMTHSVFVANAIGMPIATTFNYLMHHHWSFRASHEHKVATPRFLVALLLGYFLNSTIVKICLVAGATPTFSKLLAVPVQSPISFLLLDRWVFHTRAVEAS